MFVTFAMPKKGGKPAKAAADNSNGQSATDKKEEEFQLVCLPQDTLSNELQPNDKEDCDGDASDPDDHMSDYEGDVDEEEVAKLKARTEQETDPVQREVLETALIQLQADAVATSKKAGKNRDNLEASVIFEGRWVDGQFVPPTSNHLPLVPMRGDDGKVVEDVEGNTVMTKCPCFMQEALAINHDMKTGMPKDEPRKITVGRREPKRKTQFKPDSAAGNAGLGGKALEKTEIEGSYKWVTDCNGKEKQVF